MSTINSNPFLWTKEAVDLIKADFQWKANEIELRLKSPYQFLFIETSVVVEQPETQPQPIPNP